MKANATSAVAEFRRLLDKKKIKEAPYTVKNRRLVAPAEAGEAAAEAAIEVFKKELEKIK
jgi:hypothetical protein